MMPPACAPVLAITAAVVPPSSSAPAAAEGISVSQQDPTYRGAVLFSQRCAGCHTLTRRGNPGLGQPGRPVQGPNLDQRIESFDDVLFAIRNGGFSGAIMPQNIVTGHEADEVARFVAKYAGSTAQTTVAAARLGFTVGELGPEHLAATLKPPADQDCCGARPPEHPRGPRAGEGGARAARRRRGARRALGLDERRRELLPEVEERRAGQNRASERIAEAKRSGDDAEPRDRRDARGELARSRSSRASCPRSSRSATSSPRRCPTSPTPRPRTATPRTTP